LENFGFNEEVEEDGVKKLRLHFLPDDIEGALDADGALAGNSNLLHGRTG